LRRVGLVELNREDAFNIIYGGYLVTVTA